MDERSSEQPGSFSESPHTIVVHARYGVIEGDRLDPRSGLASIDEPVLLPELSSEPFPDDVCFVEGGRPFRPSDVRMRRRVAVENRKRRRRALHRSTIAVVRRPSRRQCRRPRERRVRRARSGSGSRGDPSGSSEGDGDGPLRPTSPAATRASEHPAGGSRRAEQCLATRTGGRR